MQTILFKIKKFIKDNKMLFIFCVIYFLMLSTFFDNAPFTDESDNFLGGLMIADGKDVYKVFRSQHMPFSYYFFAIPAVLGVSTIAGFRISFYIMMISIWVALYFRYKNSLGEKVILSYPIFYIAAMNFQDILSSAALSDQFQAQGMVILFLEFFYFLQDRRIDYKRSIMISFSIVLSFGTTFMSILGIFVIAMGVLWVELSYLLERKERYNFIQGLQYLIKKYQGLIIICLLPFLILLFYYAFTGNLYNFYYGAYKMNMDIYSKYTGIGSNIFQDILNTVSSFATVIIGAIRQVLVDPVIAMRELSYYVISILFSIYMFNKHKKYVIIVISFIFMTGIRGYIGFHAMAYFGVAIIMGILLFHEHIIYNKWMNKGVIIFFGFIIFFTTIEFVPRISKLELITKQDFQNEPTPGTYDYLVMQLVGEDESFINTDLDFEIHIRTERLPAFSPAASVPWFWEAFSDDYYKYFEDSNPKVVVMNLGYEVWGYRFTEYAADLVAYVDERYTVLSEDYPNLYVRNDFLKEAQNITGLNSINKVIN